jgi:hypothetical protein
MDTTIAAHQWGMTLDGWLGALALAAAGITVGILLGRAWASRGPAGR